MKKILLLIVVASLVTVVVRAEPPKYKIEAKTIPPFKIFLTNSYEPDPARDSLPVVEYEPKTGYTVYKTEKYEPKMFHESYRLSLDKDGKPIKALLTDKDYYESLYKAFHSIPSPYFVGDANTEFITITIIYPPSKTLAAKALTNEFFKKGVHNSYSRPLYMQNPFPPKNGAICYLDSNFQIEWWERRNNQHFVTRREAINPDSFDNWDEVPGLSESLVMGYRFYRNRCLGYIQCAGNSKTYTVNGRTFRHENLVVTKGNTAFIDYYMLSTMLACEYDSVATKEGNSNSYHYMTYRLYKEKYTVKTITLKIKSGTADYQLDGVDGRFSAAVYSTSSTIMVPLKEFCNVLKAKVIYRPLDGTILIARFFED